MFLSMLVAWMIPDVPRSLREQLKKENMMLMEFLLNQDQEARAKSRPPKRTTPCFPASIDIVVEAPPEEQQVEEEEKEEEEEGEEVVVEVNFDEPRATGDSDPEVGKTLEEVEGNGEMQRDGEGEDESGEVEGGEKEIDGEINEGGGKGVNEQEGGKENVDGGQKKEKENEVKADENNFDVDLDSFMSELGLLGERINIYIAQDQVKFVSFVSCE